MIERYVDDDYVTQNPTWHVEDAAWKADQVFAMFERNGLWPDTVSEIGCGVGEMLRILAEKLPAARLTGYEIAPVAYERAKARETDRLTFRPDPLPEGRSDVLLLIDVIEHVDDYIGLLRRVRGHAHWHMLHVPLEMNIDRLLRRGFTEVRDRYGHLHYFTRETALATVRDAGYVVVDDFLTHAVELEQPTSVRSWVGRLVRRGALRFNDDLAAKVFGGAQLLILARPDSEAA